MLRLHTPRLPAYSVLALAALLSQHGRVSAQKLLVPPRNSPAVVAAFKAVVARPSESTVRVLSTGEQLALGTIVSADGYIVTKASELRPPLTCKLKDGRVFTATVVGVDDDHDLALLKIGASRLKPIEWRSAKTAEVGNWVAAPNPDGEPAAIGVVSVGVRRPLEFEGAARTMPKQNSGYLGVQLGEEEDGSPSIAEVKPGSPAEKAGLKVKDVIISVGNRVVRTRDRLIAIIQTLRPNQEVTIKVKREDSEPLSLKVKLGRFPQEMFGRSARMNMMGSELSHRLAGFPVILQHDLLIKPHDCGGPLVDLDGKAVGINIARAGRTESYAIPSDDVQKLLPELKSGRLRPPAEDDEGRVPQLEAARKKLQAELTRVENLAKKLEGEDLEVANRRAAQLRKKLQQVNQELEKARR